MLFSGEEDMGHAFVLRGLEAEFSRYGRRPKLSKITVSIKFDADRMLDKFKLALMKAPERAIPALRRALSESLLMSIRKRFMQDMDKALRMETEARETTLQPDRGVGPSKSERKPSLRQREELRRVADSVHELENMLLEAGPNARSPEAAALRMHVRNLRQELEERYVGERKNLNRSLKNPREEIIPHRLSTLGGNQFRARMLQILRLLTENTGIVVRGDGKGNLQASIGNLAVLDKIKTPSATPALTGKTSTSPYQIMWRHLEFGTGIYRPAWAPRSLSTPFELSNNQWWYGPMGLKGVATQLNDPKNGKPGVIMKGSRPIHFLYNNQGVLYDEDAARLMEKLDQYFTPLLFPHPVVRE